MGVLDKLGIISHTTTAQPGSPSQGDSYVLPASGVSGTDWLTFENHYVQFDSSFGWLVRSPAAGTSAYNTVTKENLMYNGTTWIKGSRFGCIGSTDYTLTGSFAAIDTWASPYEEDTLDELGCFELSGGEELTVQRAVKALDMVAHFRVDMTATPAQASGRIYLARDIAGAGYLEVPGTRGGASILNTAAMDSGTVTIEYSEKDVVADTVYKWMAKMTLGSGTIKTMADGMLWKAWETV
jgi:hypothetical protein